MRVFLIEDSALVRRWRKSLLCGLERIKVVGDTGEPIAALNQIRALKPEAVILDMRLQKKYGVDLLRSIREITPSPMLIMLTHRFYRNNLTESAGTQADFSFDKFGEWDKLSEALNTVARSAPANLSV
ncbi:MAG TPA: response regulator [Thermodesulfovibrionales bacterium]|nr:response regulator [Thermodesulfovibrionales bacterium]